jgi:hypothetical protein
MSGEWLPVTDVPPNEVVELRARFGKSKTVLVYPQARCVGFEWFARGHDGYFHLISGRGTLPFVPLAWRPVAKAAPQ